MWQLLIGLAMLCIMGFFLIAIVNAYTTAQVPEGQTRLGVFLSTNGRLLLFLIGMIVLLVALGGPVLVNAINHIRVERPEIILSKDAVRAGEKFQVTYRQSFRRAVDVERILIQLIRLEADLKRKKGDRTQVHFERSYPGRRYEKGQRFEDSLEMQIPADGRPTFEDNNTIIQWYVEVEVKFAKSPGYKEGAEIRVLEANHAP